MNNTIVRRVVDMAEFAGFNLVGAPPEDRFEIYSHSYGDLRLESHVTKRVKRRGESVIVSSRLDEAGVLKKLNQLRARAIKAKAFNEKLDRERAEYASKQKELTHKLDDEWKGRLRVAFGGRADTRLPPEIKPRVLSDTYLMTRRTDRTFRITMPQDLDARAALLKSLDEVLHQHQLPSPEK